MTTRSTPTRLTLLALLALLAVASAGGCAARLGGTPPASETHAGAAPAAAPRVFRLDNRSFERLDVYVMDETREWYLGRVEPGARALLPLPRDSSFASRGTARLAVLAGVLPGAAHRLRASREPGAVLTVWQPLTRLLRQEWMFAVGDLMGQFR